MNNIPDFIVVASGGKVDVQLETGLNVGSVTFTQAHVRNLNTGDILAAQEEAERLVYTKNGGMALVMSPIRMARESLRRQVSSLTNAEGVTHNGPLSGEELGRLTTADLHRLQQAAETLDALTATSVAEGLILRGRTDAGGTERPAGGKPLCPSDAVQSA